MKLWKYFGKSLFRKEEYDGYTKIEVVTELEKRIKNKWAVGTWMEGIYEHCLGEIRANRNVDGSTG
jgi:hypothetical protein